jgi:hypothetical protein
VRGLQITSPAGFEQFIAEVAVPPSTSGRPNRPSPDIPLLIEAGRRHGNEILGPPIRLDA